MKKNITLVLLALLLVSTAACQHDTDNVKLENMRDSLSWVMGESYATALQNIGMKLNNDIILDAMRHTLEGKKQPIDDTTFQHLFLDLNSLLALNQQKQMKEQQADNAEREKIYFTQLKAKVPNIKEAKEGFYYEVLQEGKGSNAKRGEVVEFDYRSFFASNGELYDQTYGNREPIKHVVGNPMFQGLQEGLTYMNAGSRFRFYFPSDKAFGPQGDLQAGIPPYSAMIYEVELHKVQ